MLVKSIRFFMKLKLYKKPKKHQDTALDRIHTLFKEAQTADQALQFNQEQKFAAANFKMFHTFLPSSENTKKNSLN